MPFPLYSIATDFGGSFETSVFHSEMADISFASATFLGLTVNGDVVETIFNVTPSGPDQTLTNAAVAAYPTGAHPEPTSPQFPTVVRAVDPTVNDDITQGYDATTVWVNTANDRTWTCVSSAAGAAVWSRSSNWNNVDPDYIDCIDVFGGQTFTTTNTELLFDTTRIASNTAVLNRVGGTVQCLFTGVVKVTCQMSIGAASNRASSMGWIELNGSEVAGSRSWGYHRSSASDENTLSISCIIPVSTNDIIRGVIVRVGGSVTLATLADGSRLLGERIS